MRGSQSAVFHRETEVIAGCRAHRCSTHRSRVVLLSANTYCTIQCDTKEEGAGDGRFSCTHIHHPVTVSGIRVATGSAAVFKHSISQVGVIYSEARYN